jgi:hypothetical protein
MKRSKKIVSTLLVALMACSMAITPAFADDGKITNADGITSLPVTKYLQIATGATIPENQGFFFKMEPATVADNTEDGSGSKVYAGLGTGTNDDEPIYARVVMNNSTARDDTKKSTTHDYAKEVSSNDQVTGNSSFDLTQLPLAKMTVGSVYRYTVTEIEPNDAPDSINPTVDGKKTYTTSSNVVYDSAKTESKKTTYTVDLYIAKKGTSNIINTIIVKDSNGGKSNLVFNNSLTTSTLEIKKIIAGDATNADDEFTFKIKIPVGGVALDLTAGTDMGAYIVDKDNNKKVLSTDTATTDNGITVNGAVTVGGEQDDEDGWCYFTLKAGDTLYIPNVPVGMIYKVQETNSLGYSISYDAVTGNSTYNEETAEFTDNNPTIYFTTMDGNNITVFKNTKNAPNTGIRMDLMPYVIVFLGVATCAVVLVARKKRNAR